MGAAAPSGVCTRPESDSRSAEKAGCPCNSDVRGAAASKLEFHSSQGLDTFSVNGYWRTVAAEKEGQLVGLIDQGCVWWHPDHQHPPTRLHFTATGQFQMELNNELWVAVYNDGPPPSLSWNDGEVWIRDPDFEYM
mmetsp:Transcript_64504/g.154042  ORF Transcript_64504/g.154042 Transcript_64504/m.154042 type:complete len:136 (+) Transcript_64504:77-484(+)